MPRFSGPSFAALAAGIAVLAAPPATLAKSGRSHAPPTVVPTCAQLPGRTLAQSSTWRVVIGWRPNSRGALLACRRVPGPARNVVLVKARSRYLVRTQLTGGLLLRTEADQDGRYNPALHQSELIDLEGARVARSPRFPFGTYSDLNGRTDALLLAQGALMDWKWDGRGAAGAVHLTDERGTSTAVETNIGDVAVAPAPDTSEGPGAVGYAMRWDGGEPARIEAVGPPAIDWAPDASVKLIRTPVRVERRPAVRRTTLRVFHEARVEVVRTRRDGQVREKVLLNNNLVGRIVPGTIARAVTASQWFGAVDAVWADTGRRTTRFVNVDWDVPQVFLELPTPDGGWTPGQVAVSAGSAIAIAERDRLRVWDPVERVIDAPGLSALAVGENSGLSTEANLFATDATGAVRTFGLTRRKVTDPLGRY